MKKRRMQRLGCCVVVWLCGEDVARLGCGPSLFVNFAPVSDTDNVNSYNVVLDVGYKAISADTVAPFISAVIS